MTSPDVARSGAATRHPVQLAGTVVAVVFILVGVLGFVAGVSACYDQPALQVWDGHAAQAVPGLDPALRRAPALTASPAWRSLAQRPGPANHLLIGGVTYLVWWIYGLVTDPPGSANFVPRNTATGCISSRASGGSPSESARAQPDPHRLRCQLTARGAVGVDVAFDWLRRRARHTEQRLAELTHRVVNGELGSPCCSVPTFSSPDPGRRGATGGTRCTGEPALR